MRFALHSRSQSPKFKHKATQNSLWIDGCYSPHRIREELVHKGLVKSAQTEDGVGDEKAAYDKAAVSIVASLKACAKQKDLSEGARLHADVLKSGLLGNSRYVVNTLVSMYAKCGELQRAQQVFDELSARDVVTWSALIAGYVQQGHAEEALNCFEQMLCEGLCPNAVTFACILKACGSVGAVDRGKQIHSEIIRQGLLGNDIVLATALVDMYAKCAELAKARDVLNELPARDVASWNALIGGYAQHGHGEEAMNCFERMQHEGLCPNGVTFVCILKACGSMGATDKGKQIHDEILRQGLLATNVVLGNALVDMYAKCGALPKAQEVLEKLPVRDVVTWSTLIAGYAQHRHAEEALKLFEQMQYEGLLPNAVTFACTLQACGIMGAITKGIKIHDQIVRQGLLESNIVLATALVDMYAKCGALPKAQQVLDEHPARDVVSWNALIAGYADQGLGQEALNCFKRLQCEGICPDAATVISVLSACSRSGLLDEAQNYFQNMTSNYGIPPGLEHHACMVDVFGRAGHFDKAIGVIKKMPSPDYLPVWAALLGACQKGGNVNLGRLAFEQAAAIYH